MYVYVCIYMYVRIYIMDIYVCIYMFLYLHVCMYVYMRVSLSICLYKCFIILWKIYYSSPSDEPLNIYMPNKDLALHKKKFFTKDFLSKCDQICRELRIWSNLLKKFLMENFIFCAVSKDQSAEITARVASAAFHFWLPFTVNRVFNWTRLTNIVRDHFAGCSCFRGPSTQLRSYVMLCMI